MVISQPERSDGVAAPFATTLRAQPGAITLASGAGAFVIRVQAIEAWDAVRVVCRPETTIAQVKRAAMRVLLPDVDVAEAYAVKFRGAEVTDEGAALAVHGAVAGSILVLMARSRRPIR